MSVIIRLVLFAVPFLLGLAGCGSLPSSDVEFKEVVYPPPPEQPRFYYEYTLTNSAQVTSTWDEMRMRKLFTGESTTGEGMSKPFDVAVCQGVVYVSDTVQRIVHAYDFPRKKYFRVGEGERGDLEKPLGLAVDSSCNLYVADGSQSRVVIFNAEGEYLAAVGGSQWFEKLSHVTTDPEGERLYMVDTGGVQSQNHRIRVFDTLSGKHLYDIGTRGSGDMEFNLPRDISYFEGRLYVVDGGNFRVQVLTAQGEHLMSFGEIGDRWGQFSRPKGIDVDGDGNIYVSDAGFGNFQIFNSEGHLLLVIGDRSNTVKPGRYMLPSGLDLDEDGRVYFIGQFFRKIDVFRPAGLKAEEGFLGSFLGK